MSSELTRIGDRLRAYRLGAGLSVDDVATKLHLSRATTYRLEKLGINRLDTLARVARLLGISLASLLGVDSEYIASAVTYFERVRQIERDAERMFISFGPVSYLLTTHGYDRILRQALMDHVPVRAAGRKRHQEIVEAIMTILASRKSAYRQRRPALTNVLSAADIERFAHYGLMSGETIFPADNAHRKAAIAELRHIAAMMVHPPLGVQIGVVFDTMPSTGFNILHQPGQTVLSVSPFRLGPHLNIRKGVAMITTTAEPVRIYDDLANDIWRQAISGEQAAAFVLAQIDSALRRKLA